MVTAHCYQVPSPPKMTEFQVTALFCWHHWITIWQLPQALAYCFSYLSVHLVHTNMSNWRKKLAMRPVFLFFILFLQSCAVFSFLPSTANLSATTTSTTTITYTKWAINQDCLLIGTLCTVGASRTNATAAAAAAVTSVISPFAVDGRLILAERRQ